MTISFINVTSDLEMIDDNIHAIIDNSLIFEDDP